MSYVSSHQKLFGEIYRIPPSQVAAWVNKQNWQRALISAIAVCGASLSKLACQIGVIMPSGGFGSVWTQTLQLARKTNDSRDSRGDKATLVAVKILPKSFVWSLLPRTLLPRTCVPYFIISIANQNVNIVRCRMNTNNNIIAIFVTVSRTLSCSAWWAVGFEQDSDVASTVRGSHLRLLFCLFFSCNSFVLFYYCAKAL